MLLAQAAHAITFAAHHSVCMAWITRHFPGRLRARGQALYTVLGYGLPGVLGGVAGGALSEAAGYAAVFWAAAAAGALAALAGVARRPGCAQGPFGDGVLTRTAGNLHLYVAKPYVVT